MKNLTFLLFVIHFSLFTIYLSEAQIIHVPGDYQTIQEGIAAAANGDTVLVDTGLYYENIDFLGKKPLLVASHFLLNGDTNYINKTIINGSQPVDPNWGSVVIMQSEEDTTSVLCGFTITGGTGTFIAEAGNSRFGGGVFITYGGKVMNNHIEYNIMTNSDWTAGGGVALLGPESPPPYCILKGNRIAHNKAISDNNEGDGGGVANFWNLTLEDNEIVYNEASGPYRGDGGGVYIHGDGGHIDLEIRNNSIKYNKAASNSAITDIVISGGIDIFNDCSGIVSNNDISFNEIEVAEGRNCYGTGVMIEQIPTTDFIFENNFVTNNSFSGTTCMGGGALIYDGLCRFQNNVIRDNTGTHGGGVAIGYNVDKQAIIINNTITGNTGEFGGGLYGESADAVVINTIIWGNTAPYAPSIGESNCTIPVIYSDVEGDDYWPGEGNENEDPGFGDDGYHLGDSSPLWNGGIGATVINGITYECPEYDIDGEPRPFNIQDPDIGADETPSIHAAVDEPAVGGQQSAVMVYPNPTSGIVNFQFTGYNLQSISLKVYNAQGQEVAVVLDGEWSGGQVVRWDATSLPAGVYYYRLSTIDNRQSTMGRIVKY